MATKELIGSLTDLGGQKAFGTIPKHTLPTGPAPGIANVDLSQIDTGLGVPEELAFRAALGTVAPTYWIAPSTYEVALEHFVPFRSDPEFVDPDIIEIVSHDNKILVEFKLRLRVDDAVLEAVSVADSPDVVVLPERSSSSIRLLEEPLETGPVPPIELDTESAASVAASVAAEVRDLSGLNTRQLGEVFPVARESFQRWISGASVPTSENFERLLALQHFLRALADRVDNPRLWLLAPLEESPSDESAYSLLQRGNLRKLWDAVSLLPTRTGAEEFIDSEGTRGIRIASSLRRGDAPTPSDEADDYAEWLDEE